MESKTICASHYNVGIPSAKSDGEALAHCWTNTSAFSSAAAQRVILPPEERHLWRRRDGHLEGTGAHQRSGRLNACLEERRLFITSKAAAPAAAP